MDQALLLIAAIDKGHRFIRVKALLSECAALQWCFWAILIQIALKKHTHIKEHMPESDSKADNLDVLTAPALNLTAVSNADEATDSNMDGASDTGSNADEISGSDWDEIS